MYKMFACLHFVHSAGSVPEDMVIQNEGFSISFQLRPRISKAFKRMHFHSSIISENTVIYWSRQMTIDDLRS